MRGALEEQRQEEFDPAGRHAGADVAVHRLLRKIAAEAQSIAAPELAHRLGVQGGFARRQQLNALQFVERTLRLGIEAPNAVDVSIQQIDAVRSVRTHRENIDERTPNRELAMRHDLSDRGITGHRQLRAQRLEIERLVEMYFERVGLDVAAGRQSLQQRVDGNQPHAVARARQLCQRREAGGGDVRMSGEAVIGQRLQIGEHPDIETGSGKELNFLA